MEFLGFDLFSILWLLMLRLSALCCHSLLFNPNLHFTFFDMDITVTKADFFPMVLEDEWLWDFVFVYTLICMLGKALWTEKCNIAYVGTKYSCFFPREEESLWLRDMSGEHRSREHQCSRNPVSLTLILHKPPRNGKRTASQMVDLHQILPHTQCQKLSYDSEYGRFPGANAIVAGPEATRS